MAKLESSSIDWPALEAAAEEWQGLRDFLHEKADQIADRDKVYVAEKHNKYRGMPYKVSVTVYTGNGLPRAVIRAPINAFLGVKDPAGRRQLYAYGHRLPEPIFHVADDYILRDAATSIFG